MPTSTTSNTKTITEFEQPLILTTPYARGQKVKDAQWLMAGHNRFSTGKHPVVTYHGNIDGIYGTQTSSSTRLTKYLLGYPDDALDHRFGQQLYDYLTKKALPTEFTKRRLDRIAALADPIKVKALHRALLEIGTREYPFGTNDQKYGAWYGANGLPWCAIFESWCMHEVGADWFKYASVETIYRDAQYGHNHLTLTHTPEPGDLVCYHFNGHTFAHTAFFKNWVVGSDTLFYDLGGNTGPVDMSNGGMVLSQERRTDQVTAFVRINA